MGGLGDPGRSPCSGRQCSGELATLVLSPVKMSRQEEGKEKLLKSILKGIFQSKYPLRNQLNKS